MSFDPGQAQVDVDRGSARLEKAADALYKATINAAEAELAYKRAVEKEKIAIYHEAKRAGERMPAEDVRDAICHERIEDELYARHLLTKAELSAQEKTLAALRASVSAKQSVLNALRGT